MEHLYFLVKKMVPLLVAQWALCWNKLTRWKPQHHQTILFFPKFQPEYQTVHLVANIWCFAHKQKDPLFTFIIIDIFLELHRKYFTVSETWKTNANFYLSLRSGIISHQLEQSTNSLKINWRHWLIYDMLIKLHSTYWTVMHLSKSVMIL